MATQMHKRSSSGLEKDNNKPAKCARMEETSRATDALTSANARIKELEHQVLELHAFLNATGMTRSTYPSCRPVSRMKLTNALIEAPISIRQYMDHQPDAARILAAQIKSEASKVSHKLSDKVLRSRKTGVTSDDISAAMVPFLNEVDGVRRLPNGVRVAFDLVMALAANSYGELDSGGSGYGERPSDEIVDELLSELAPERRAIDPSWDFVEVLEDLKQHAELLGDYGIEDFCSSTIKLLSEWKDSLPSDKQFMPKKDAQNTHYPQDSAYTAGPPQYIYGRGGKIQSIAEVVCLDSSEASSDGDNELW